MPYRSDLLVYHDIGNQDLEDHIDCVGVVIYSRAKVSIAQDPDQPYPLKYASQSCLFFFFDAFAFGLYFRHRSTQYIRSLSRSTATTSTKT